MSNSSDSISSQDGVGQSALNGNTLVKIQICVIVVGGFLLSMAANYSTLWFDEAYSVAMACHGFADIWDIGSCDVHPVLYYWILHCVFLVFGDSVFAFRLVSVAGLIVLALLGLTHVRKDFGCRTGFLFTVFVFLVPWSIRVAFQIRMYEWVAVAVMICAIYGWRIVRQLRWGDAKNQTQKNVPLHWWMIVCLSSVAAAYLHYYGALAAFCVQLLVLIAIIRFSKRRTKHIVVWLLFAVVAIAMYAPWIMVAFGQAASVSGGFWISFEYPISFAELILFPFDPPELISYDQITLVNGDSALFIIILFILIVIAEMACMYQLGKEQVLLQGKENEAALKHRFSFFLGIFGGVFVIAGLASVIMDQPVLYYRYLAVALGPLILAIASAFASIRSLGFRVACGLLVCTLSYCTYFSLFTHAYSPMNDECLTAYGELCDQVKERNGGETLVFSDNVLVASIVAMGEEGEPIVYLDPRKDYEAFVPRFIMDSDWPTLLDGFTGEAIFIGSEYSASEFAEEFEGIVLSSEGFFHPYSRDTIVYSTIAF